MKSSWWSDAADAVSAMAGSASIGQLTLEEGGTWQWSYQPVDGPAEHVVLIDIADAFGSHAATTFTLQVQNVPPVATILGPETGFVAAVNTPVVFEGLIADAGGVSDILTIQWTFSTAFTQTEIPLPVTTFVIDPITGEAVLTSQLVFPEAGIYSVRLSATDKDGGAGETTFVRTASGDLLPAFVVIYDPEGGFVTGGGWILSPPGAFFPGSPEFADVEGKATFGFVAKYKKGANVPTGTTEFQFKAADLNFHSDSYQWLVVAGARAQFKGWGSITLFPAEVFGFMLTAIDGQLNGGGGTDKFRIKIWYEKTGEIVYDNQVNSPDDAEPSTVIGGGSIVIHKEK